MGNYKLSTMFRLMSSLLLLLVLVVNIQRMAGKRDMKDAQGRVQCWISGRRIPCPGGSPYGFNLMCCCCNKTLCAFAKPWALGRGPRCKNEICPMVGCDGS